MQPGRRVPHVEMRLFQVDLRDVSLQSDATHVCFGVKSGKAQDEQMFSGLPRKRTYDLRINEYTPQLGRRRRIAGGKYEAQSQSSQFRRLGVPE
jgi:hypothetical protein